MSLPDVARLAAAGDSFDRCLANFLDEFYAHPQIVALLETPILLQPCLGDLGLIQDAYLAATAEELASSQKMTMPDWIVDEKRSLRRPWFASPLTFERSCYWKVRLDSVPGTSSSAKTPFRECEAASGEIDLGAWE